MGVQDAGILHHHSIHFHRSRRTHLRLRTCSTPTTPPSLDASSSNHRTRCCRTHCPHPGRYRILHRPSQQAQKEKQAPDSSLSLVSVIGEPFALVPAASSDAKSHTACCGVVNQQQPAYVARVPHKLRHQYSLRGHPDMKLCFISALSKANIGGRPIAIAPPSLMSAALLSESEWQGHTGMGEIKRWI